MRFAPCFALLVLLLPAVGLSQTKAATKNPGSAGPKAPTAKKVDKKKLEALIEDLRDAIDDTAEHKGPRSGRKFTTKAADSTKIVLVGSGSIGALSTVEEISIPWKSINRIGLDKTGDGETHFLLLWFREKLECSFTVGSELTGSDTKKGLNERQDIVFSKRRDARTTRDLFKAILNELGVTYTEKDGD